LGGPSRAEAIENSQHKTGADISISLIGRMSELLQAGHAGIGAGRIACSLIPFFTKGIREILRGTTNGELQ
jgi:hypothetical protein